MKQYVNVKAELETALQLNATAEEKKTDNRNKKEIHFFINEIIRSLFGVVLFLVLAHLFSLYLVDTQPKTHLTLFIDKHFNLGKEANIPTFFSGCILLAASALLFAIYLIEEKARASKNKIYWLALSILFLFLSLDEASRIHEELMETVRNYLSNSKTGYNNFSGYLQNAWVIPYGIFLFATVAYFLKFVLGLPKTIRNLFFISGFIYVTGALGFEILEGHIEMFYGRGTLLNICVIIEETMEMCGVITFIYALLLYIVPLKIAFSKNQNKTIISSPQSR
jgi:hypothetical protein